MKLPRWLTPPASWNPVWRAVRRERDEIRAVIDRQITAALDNIREEVISAGRLEVERVLKDLRQNLSVEIDRRFDPED